MEGTLEGLNPMMAGSHQDCLQAAVDLELPHDTFRMVFDGFGADEELRADFFCAEALGQQTEHGHLAAA